MSTTISPLHNYVLVEIDPPETTERPSGLVAAPDLDRRVIGTVVSVGPDVMEADIRSGVKVLVPPYGAGQVIRVGVAEYVMYLDHEILGTFKAES